MSEVFGGQNVLALAFIRESLNWRHGTNTICLH
jgi:hypothetical protein